MSFRREKFLSLAGPVVNNLSLEELKSQSRQMLQNGIHGICFSAYDEGQKPGDQLSEAQVRRKLAILKPHISWVRTFSCTEGNEIIARVAHEMGIKTLVGAWLGDDLEKNEGEIEGLISLCKEGVVDVAAVGNEVLYREDLTVDVLIDYIKRVKEEVTEVPVGYVDAYYEFTDHPEVADVCDIILANCYPYWEGCSLEYSLMYMKQMYFEAQAAGKGKPVLITETGWPSSGQSIGGAHASFENSLKYFINAQRWSKEEDIPMFYFSSFDESWKIEKEGDVGASWGLWDKDEKLKF
ncbi:MAG: glycosyl hydrolase family 17 protein [Schleiferiaceae bacterium]